MKESAAHSTLKLVNCNLLMREGFQPGMVGIRTQGDICRHAEDHGLGEGCGLGEEVEIVQGEDELHRLVHLNGHLGRRRNLTYGYRLQCTAFT